MMPCVVIPCAVGLLASAMLGLHPLKVLAGYLAFIAALFLISAFR